MSRTDGSGGLIPFQHHGYGAAGGQRERHVDVAGAVSVECFGLAVDGLACTGNEGRLVALVSVVRGRRKIRDARRNHLINGLRDDAVLEHRFEEIRDIIDNDFRAGVRERDDVVGEVGLTALCSRKGERRAGRDVIDNLRHPAAFVGGAAILQDLHAGREIAGRDVGAVAAEIVEAVGYHADLDACAVDPE